MVSQDAKTLDRKFASELTIQEFNDIFYTVGVKTTLADTLHLYGLARVIWNRDWPEGNYRFGIYVDDHYVLFTFIDEYDNEFRFRRMLTEDGPRWEYFDPSGDVAACKTGNSIYAVL